jgi:hypothetical protein
MSQAKMEGNIMLNKVAGLARAVGLILAVVAAFVAIPAQVPLILVVLGIVAGLAYSSEDIVRLAITAVALPLVGAALAVIPQIGTQLTAVAGNAALAVAGALATRVAVRLYELVVGDLKGLAS